jgi:hypothetical protein
LKEQNLGVEYILGEDFDVLDFKVGIVVVGRRANEIEAVARARVIECAESERSANVNILRKV